MQVRQQPPRSWQAKYKLKGKKPLLVACDVYRPAAIKQLQVNGEKQGVEVFAMGDKPQAGGHRKSCDGACEEEWQQRR